MFASEAKLESVRGSFYSRKINHASTKHVFFNYNKLNNTITNCTKSPNKSSVGYRRFDKKKNSGCRKRFHKKRIAVVEKRCN